MDWNRREVARAIVPVQSASDAPALGGIEIVAWGPSAGNPTRWIPVYTRSRGDTSPLEIVASGGVEVKLARWGYTCAVEYCPYLPAWAVAFDGARAGPSGLRLPYEFARPLELQLRFRHANGGTTYFGFFGPSDALEASLYLPSLDEGTLEVARVPFHCIGAGPCFTFTGGQTLTVNVLERQEELVLECRTGSATTRGTPSSPGQARITRGGEIACAAISDSPGKTVTVREWSFSGGGQRIPRTGAQRTDASWAGKMVVSGSISVTGVVGEGQPGTASVQVTVADRPGWASSMPYPAAEPQPRVDVNGEEDWPAMPVRDSAGYDVWVSGGFGQYSYGIDWQGSLTSIGSGPNANWWYFSQPPGWLEPRVWISPFLAPDHPFYTSQHRRRSGERAPQRYGDYCSQSDMVTIAREVVAHEGQVGGPRISHHEHKVNYVGRNDPGPAMERVTFYAAGSTVPIQDLVGAELDAAYMTTLRADDQTVVHAARNLFTPTCKLRY